MNPTDATELGATPGALIAIESMYGSTLLRALLTPRVAQGQLFAPMHWTRQRTTNGTVNSVAAPITDPVSGQPALKSNAVIAQVYKAKWYGFLACINEPTPQTPYAAIARTQTGWQVEMAGGKTPVDWVTEARQLCGQSGGDVSIQADPTTGSHRIAITRNGQITALFFAAPNPVVVSRTAIIDMIGTDTPSLAALAGRTRVQPFVRVSTWAKILCWPP
jgi:assimilatory nitrate reductase catalytic subunit